MKTWLLQTKRIPYIEGYTCYCEEDPVDLIVQSKYEDVYNELMDDLYNSFGYLCDTGPDEDTEDWTDDDWGDYHQEQFNNFCKKISFESKEINENEAENYPVLIDER